MKLPTIPGFEIIEQLGVGGMATVWKARQISLDRIVAIKVLSAQYAYEPSDVEQFQKEAQAAARLKHIGIVQVYDAKAQNGLYYFVMEYVAGYTVGDWVRRREKLSEQDSLLVADCVADALGYAWHSAGIIHCDVKPDNVIIDSDGTVKVADLGLARTISAMSAEEPGDEVMGTPAYIAPEQAKGVPDLDCRADIYALGAMLYHLVTGKMLFQGNPEDRVMDMQVEDYVPDACDLNPSVSQPMCWLLERMLAKHRHQRHPDWDGVRRDIDRVRKGWSPVAHLPTGARSTMKRSPRRTLQTYRKLQPPGERHESWSLRLAATVGAIIALAAAGWVGWYLWRNADLRRVSGYPVPTVPASPTTTTQAQSVVSIERKRFEEAMRFEDHNPDRYDDAIARFMEVVQLAPTNSPYIQSANQRIELIKAAKEQAVDSVLAPLREKAMAKVQSGDFEAALEVVTGYSGPLAAETRRKRDALVTELRDEIERRRQDRQRKHQLHSKELSKLVADLTNLMLDEGMMAAEAYLRNGATPALRQVDEDGLLGDMEAQLERAASVERNAMQSFAGQIGTEQEIDLESGSRKLRVVQVQEGHITAVDPGDPGQNLTFTFTHLAPRERLMRLARMSDDAVPLVKASVAAQSRAFRHARRCLADTSDSLLAELMLDAISERETQFRDEEARRAMSRLLRQTGATVPEYELQEWIRIAQQASISVDSRDAIREAVDRFMLIYGNTRFAKETEPVLAALAEHLE